MANQNSGRIRMLLENYITAKQDGVKEGFDIKTVVEDNYEHFYILLKPLVGIYRDQFHILEMKTTYGHGSDSVSYPINAPYIRFNTAIFHTNISTQGAICLDILKDKSKWSPMNDFSSIVRNIMTLLEDPNNSSAFNGEASSAHIKCDKEYKAKYNKYLSYAQQEVLKEECFREFKQQCDNYANKNKKELEICYSKWFPQLLGGKQNMDELNELSTILESMKLAKKKKNTGINNSGINPNEQNHGMGAGYIPSKPVINDVAISELTVRELTVTEVAPDVNDKDKNGDNTNKNYGIDHDNKDKPKKSINLNKFAKYQKPK